MKGAVAAAVLVATVLGTALAAVPASAGRLSASPARDVPVVETGQTFRLSGGQFVHVRIGDVALGVVWSTNETAGGGLSLFIDYVRYFGGAEIYDEQGSYLGTRALPLHTILFQHFDKMAEFRDLDHDGLFDLRLESRNGTTDLPVKAVDLNRAWSLDGPIQKVVTSDSAWVNFTVGTSNAPYSVFDPVLKVLRPAPPGYGALDKLSLTFHLAASIRQGSLDVPFYKVTVANGDVRVPTASEFLGNRTITGTTISVNGKYDQRIEGWDFNYTDSKLVLGTSLGFANYINQPIVQWLQQQFGGACLKDGTFQQCQSDAGPAQPEKIARTDLEITEGFHRAGGAYWTSNVTVDGNPETMTFEIYWAQPIHDARLRGDAAVFNGFRAYGGFVYPQGKTIVHDPGLQATSAIPLISETTNLTPLSLAGLEVAVVGVALVPALLLRRRTQPPKGRP